MAQSRRAVVWSVCGCLVWLGLATGTLESVAQEKPKDQEKSKDLDWTPSSDREKRAVQRAAELGVDLRRIDEVSDTSPDPMEKFRYLTALMLLENLYDGPNGKVAGLIKDMAAAGRIGGYCWYVTDGAEEKQARANFEFFCKVLREVTRPPEELDEMEWWYQDIVVYSLLVPMDRELAFAAIMHAQSLDWYFSPRNKIARAYFEDTHTYGREHVPCFDVYESFLRIRELRKLGTEEGAERLIDHMFRTDCVQAMDVMLRLKEDLRYDADDNRYSYPYILHSKDGRQRAEQAKRWKRINVDVQAKRELFRLDGTLPEQDAKGLTQQLANMLSHNKWWVRLYALEAMRQTPPLADADLAKGLLKDERTEVRRSAEQVIQVAKAYKEELRRKAEVERIRRSGAQRPSDLKDSDR